MDIIQNLYESATSSEHKLGELYISPEGRKYRYVKNGAVALVTGNLIQEPAEDTAFRSLVCSAATAIGSKEIKVTLGGTAVTAGMFDNGDLVVESGTGIGQYFKIVSHDVQTSTTGVLTIQVDRAVKIALVASDSNISIRKNSYNGVIQYPTTPTGAPLGIALYAMAASTATVPVFGWIQSGGDAVALFDNQGNSAADATGLMPSLDVAGSVRPALAADVAPAHIGFSRELVSVDSTMGLVHLTID